MKMTAIKNNNYYNQLDTLDPVEEKLYRILKGFKDNITHKCHPSIKTLEIKLKRCRQTTKKYLKMLAEKGFIHIRERKVKHKVTNNKFNETNEYTLLLEKFNGSIKKVNPDDKQETSPLILKETDLEKVMRKLKSSYSEDSVSAALKTMRKNIRNGSIISNMKNYLESLINKSSNQLKEVDKAIESLAKDSTSTSSSKPKSKENSNYKSNSNRNKVSTKFHNFEQRTDKYGAEELEAMVLRKSKKKHRS